MSPAPTARSDVSETVLVVEDSVLLRDIVVHTLQDHGYRVLAADSGEQALQLMTTRPRPDLVLLDVLLPGIDGFELLRRWRADPATAALPVMLLTALHADTDELRGLQLGADDYLTKPVQPLVLLARVRTQLDAARARASLRDQNARLEAEVARRMAENELVQDLAIRALAHLAETRDNETGRHLQRTQAYVEMLAQDLYDHGLHADQLGPRQIRLLARSAPLHDIGKVGIPDHILLKPGKLDAAEWAVMQTHAALGAQAIEAAERDVDGAVDFLRLAKQIAHWHHERWDGSGYPDGLAGDAIPLGARLMALADVFDSLVSPRVYKRPMPCDEAREVIRQGRGQHFDPAVVDEFERCYAAFCAIAATHADEPDNPAP